MWAVALFVGGKKDGGVHPDGGAGPSTLYVVPYWNT